MRDEYIYYVYIMQSASRRALYIGMTNNLRRRVWEHKNHTREGFTDDYNCTRLVYWESFDDVVNAINREKQQKRWRREKKMWLIERKNPGKIWQLTGIRQKHKVPRLHMISQKPRDHVPLGMTTRFVLSKMSATPTHCHPERKRTIRRIVSLEPRDLPFACTTSKL